MRQVLKRQQAERTALPRATCTTSEGWWKRGVTAYRSEEPARVFPLQRDQLSCRKGTSGASQCQGQQRSPALPQPRTMAGSARGRRPAGSRL